MKGKGKTTRRDAREWALQLLFQMDMNPGTFDKVTANFWAGRKASQKARSFTETIVKGVLDNLGQIDGMIAKYTENWSLNRITVVDRNVLRMAIYEMLFSPDIPHAVVINEAVDISKYFGSNVSGKFVNGILDRVRLDTGKESNEKT